MVAATLGNMLRSSLRILVGILGLASTGAMCQKGGNAPPSYAEHGETCEQSADCLPPLVCAGDQTCRIPGEPGTAGQGEVCLSTEYCAAGLVCDAEGSCAEAGAPGTAGWGEECAQSEDCQLGYSCEGEVCVGLQLPLWFGGECEEHGADTGPARGYFEVGQRADFYRLPFPNDALVTDGVLDLEGHASPGALIPELGDVVGTVMESLVRDFDGFGNNQAVFFRFSQGLDFDSLALTLPSDGGNVAIVDLTPGPTYGYMGAGSFKADTGRGQYICHDWLAMAPPDGRPLLPGHTYAAVITSEVTSGGQPLAQDEHFAAVMGTNKPSDASLGPIWESYAPLRQWAEEEAVDLAVATVFTVGDPHGFMQDLREAIEPLGAPELSELHLCTEDGGPFATDEEPERGCLGQSLVAQELQGLVSLPQFQLGSPPFKTPADGGSIDFSKGAPISSRSEEVQFTLTVPLGDMPEEGWPLVIYGHGTGGDTRSPVRNGITDALAEVTLDDGRVQRFAVLSIDAVLHGPRRHEENWDLSWLSLDPGAYDPDVLYFNPLNPRAARDNALQAAADVWMLVKAAQALDWDQGSSPTGEALRFDDIHYLGHSQGSTTGVGMAAYEPSFRSAVFSAAGGLLIETLLNKTSPNDLGAAIAVGLADPDLSRHHPLLNIAQGAAERSDPINHAGRLLDAEGAPTNVFQVYGLGDTYTPDPAQWALVRALGSVQVVNGNSPLAGVSQLSPPVSGTHLAGTVTGAVGLYESDGAYDPHFVLFHRDDALRQTAHFLATASLDGTGVVVAPQDPMGGP